jgi:sugar/nucleoside kinase (ribokinase family)
VRDKQTDVVLVGAVTLDELEDASRVPGGSVLYASRVYRGLGVRVGVVTRAGAERAWEDDFEGVALEVQGAAETTRFVNRYEGDGVRTQRVEAYAGEVAAGAWAGGGVRALHLAPVYAEVDAVAWAREVDHEVCVMNLQGWVRRAERIPGRVVPRVWGGDDHRLEVADVVVLSKEDLEGQGDLLERLRERVELVVVTDGAFGCDVFEGGERAHVEAYATEAVDPTGAGDVFSAGLVAGLLRGEDPVEAARLGCAAASVVIEGVGASALDRIEEAWVRREEVGVRRSRRGRGRSPR